MNNRRNTFIYRKYGLLLVAAVSLLTAYLLGQRSTLSNSVNLRPEVGTRGLGLGGAFICSADDATGPLWNPAGLAALQQGNLIYDLSQGAVSLAYPLKPIGTFGINFLDLNGNDRFLLKHTANPIGSFELGDNQVLFSYARGIGPLQIGASTGYSRAPYYGSRWAPNYDIGLLTELNQYLTFGIRLRDISGVTIHHRNGQILQTFDQQLALGTQLTPHPIIRWHSRLDFHPYCFGTSVEIGTQAVAAHAGATFPLGIQAPPSSWSIGASFNQFGKQLHYTYLNQQNFETRHLVSVGMSFGGRHTFLQQLQLPIHKRSPTIIPTSKPKPPLKQIDPAYESVQIAKQYDIELPLLLAIVYVESNFNPIAVSPSGAAGLMQMMPQTARGLGIKVPQYTDKRTPRIDPRLDERFDPRKNLHAGLTYFKKLLKKYRNDVTRALGAYNVGTGRVEIGQPLNSRAQKYADKVLKRCQYYRANPTEKQAALKRLEATLK